MIETNRRLHERQSWGAQLSIRVGREHDLADALDVGVWGMSFRTRTPIMVGDNVRIHIEGDDDRPSLPGRVCHVAIDRGQYLVGVEYAR